MTMTLTELQIRPIEAADNEQLYRFLASYADGGAFKFQVIPKTQDVLGAYQARNPRNIGMIAYLGQQPVGMLWAVPQSDVSYREKTNLTGVLLNSLAVHPNHRQQGVASSLVRETETFLRSRFEGRELLFYGYIQARNKPSQAVGQKFEATFTDNYTLLTSVKTLPKRPALDSRFVVEQISPPDFLAAAEGYNACYASEVHKHPVQTVTPQTFVDFLKPSNVGGLEAIYTRYYVIKKIRQNQTPPDATQESKPLAGLGVIDIFKLFDLKLLKAPKIFYAANKLLKIVPPDGIVRSKEIKLAWCNPTDWAAGRVLFEQVRFLEQAGDAGEEDEEVKLTLSFGKTSQVARMFGNLRLSFKAKAQLVMRP
jgi:GNAT superfamily N-acetyltransferase